eukprot:3405729-Rhodomonas_salina.1
MFIREQPQHLQGFRRQLELGLLGILDYFVLSSDGDGELATFHSGLLCTEQRSKEFLAEHQGLDCEHAPTVCPTFLSEVNLDCKTKVLGSWIEVCDLY